MQGGSEFFSSVKASGERKPYLQIDRVEGLVAAAQPAASNCILELRSRTRPHAGPVDFRSDPAPDVDFDEVIEAAKEMRERLEAIGLTAFCKTTGGKGLHVVTPLKSGDAKR